jgi:cytoskeleton protein RodZ
VNETSGAGEQRELTVAEVAARALPGAQLRAARESMGLSVNDVAQSIKFSPRQIEALERDDHSPLPAGPTFIRGFVRSYAKLLRVDATPLLDALPREVPVEVAELTRADDLGTRLPMPGQKRDWMPVAAVAALAVALAALAVHYFYRGEAKPSSTRQSPVAAAEVATPVVPPVPPAPAAPVAAPPSPAALAPAASPLPAAPPPPVAALVPPPVAKAPPVPAAVPVPVPSAAASAPAAASAAVGGRRHQLIFMFDSEAWVEVKDASQRVIFSQVNAGGTRQVVTGAPPFDMVIGNASSVHLQYDGHPVDLAPDTRAEVARLTLQ